MACLDFGVMLDSGRSVRFVGQEDRVDSILVPLHGVAELVPVIYFVEHCHIIRKTLLREMIALFTPSKTYTYVSVG